MLHIINKSPFQSKTFESCLRLVTAGDVVLFMEDGVYTVIATAVPQMVLSPVVAAKSLQLYALKPDTEARGITHRLLKQVQLIDYSGFVELTTHYPRIQTWL